MRGSSRKIATTTVALACISALLAIPGGATGYHASTRDIGHGVTYTNVYNPRGPWHIRYLTVDLSADSTLDLALSNNEIPGFETTSSMAKRHGAIAAINGDYGRSTGRPVDTFAVDGRIVTTSLIYGRNFEWDQQETSTFIGHPKITSSLRPSTTGPITIGAVNDTETSPAKTVREFTSRGGYVEQPPQNECQARIEATGSPGFNPGGGTQTPVVVAKTRCGRSLNRSGSEVVSAKTGSSAAAQIASLVRGESATLRWSGDVPNLMDTVGGNPTLIEGGKIQHQSVDGRAPFLGRHPRTGIGTTPDGRVL
ncbi:MAG: phosphodiester glycosidase family protein, partial [Actinomycetota bacterium]